MIRTLTLTAIAALATNAWAQDPSAVPLGDDYFAMKAYSEALAEVAKSRLAIEKATEPAVKAFAEHMVKNHTECNNKIAELARKEGITLPAVVDFAHTAATARLAKMSGSDFDKVYPRAQIGARMDAIHLFEHEAHRGEDAELKELAAQTIPTLKEHTKEAFVRVSHF